ncbi:ABC transporter permease [Amycolatopsis saalfeldensis]|uniref:Peptide/nickel transport system permease protein n=1 Tax=Amycolatopsis saalfeldensis TaxID=394193 RepID=A0A1H8YLU9_9PSEU|nr:ABC transporter permease [Amycolatopsis saalfeldensis]SEP53126.1 peptide/nickel transport system permease protein [Amycolatopsis saalfeldensis]
MTSAPARTQWQLARRRFLRHKLAVAGLSVLAVLLVCCFGADWIAPFARNAQDLALGPALPSGAHWLGTDELGRDYLSEILYAGRISLAIGLSVAVLATALGTTLGAVAGYFGGWVDEVVMRVTDLFLVVPAIVVLALALQGFGKSPATIVLVLASLFWTYVARVVRGQVLSLREKEYVAAAKVLGARRGRIVLRHILPNLTGVIAVNTSLGAATAVIIESTLSFLGYGVQPPETSWGNMLSQASGLIGTDKVYLLYFPGLFILLTAIAINFVGDGLRDALDPQGARP